MSEEHLARQMPPASAPQAEYESIYAAVMQSEKGRRFLDEYARRSLSGTDPGAAAIRHLQTAMRGETDAESLDLFLLEVADMAQAIERTKAEIAAIKPLSDRQGQIDDATEELDSIVQATEQATSRILAAAEQVQEIAWTLREKGIDQDFCNQLDAQATEIYTACSFQDLTGQRTRKVIQVLRYLESRINAMIAIWGKDLPAPAVTETNSGEAALLSGPTATGLNQADVDVMMQPPAAGERQDATIEDISRFMMELEPLMAAHQETMASESPREEDPSSLVFEERRPELSVMAAVLAEDMEPATSEPEPVPVEQSAVPDLQAIPPAPQHHMQTAAPEFDLTVVFSLPVADQEPEQDIEAPLSAPETEVEMDAKAEPPMPVEPASRAEDAESAWSVLDHLQTAFALLPPPSSSPSLPEGERAVASQMENVTTREMGVPIINPPAVMPALDLEWPLLPPAAPASSPEQPIPPPIAGDISVPEPSPDRQAAAAENKPTTSAPEQPSSLLPPVDLDCDEFLFAPEPAMEPPKAISPLPQPPAPAAESLSAAPPEKARFPEAASPSAGHNASAIVTFAPRAPGRAGHDPLAPLRALSDEEKIALFS